MSFVNANTLRSNESQKSSLAKEVATIIESMNDEILNAHKEGRHKVTVKVPTQFGIPYMEKTDAQRDIYYKILTGLLAANFFVAIDMRKDRTLYEIRWITDKEIAEIDAQNTLLAKHRKKKVQDLERGLTGLSTKKKETVAKADFL
jgi:hypothetical protein